MPYDIILCLIPLGRGPSVIQKLTVLTELTGPGAAVLCLSLIPTLGLWTHVVTPSLVTHVFGIQTGGLKPSQ